MVDRHGPGMLRVALRFLVLLVPAALYVASPFWAAWRLREAVRNGDLAAIERKVEWEAVRSSLKSSLARHAQLLPQITAAGEQIEPTLWQRLKSAMGATMLDRFIDNYVTPAGLPRLYQFRRVWNEQVNGEPDEASLTGRERFKRFYARVIRAEFQALTRVEIEVADKHVPERRYVSVLELVGLEWKLTSLRVVTADNRRAETGKAPPIQ
jgi:hypothetical protein